MKAYKNAWEITVHKAICHLHRGQKEIKFEPSPERSSGEVPGSTLREKGKAQPSPVKTNKQQGKNAKMRLKILLIF